MLKVRLVALTTLVAAGALVFSLQARSKRSPRTTPAGTQASAAPSSAGAQSAGAPGPSVVIAEPAPTIAAAGKDFSLLPDGKPVPELPATAPRTCGFGAILLTFEGAQFAPRRARTKSEAYQLAKTLIAEASVNFADAVKKGDPGSLADAGSIGRQILERSVEYRLFTLEKGELSPEPVETPRGYWVLKRLR